MGRRSKILAALECFDCPSWSFCQLQILIRLGFPLVFKEAVTSRKMAALKCFVLFCVRRHPYFTFCRVAGHPLAQNERCLHMFLLEPVIDKNYVPGKVRTTWCVVIAKYLKHAEHKSEERGGRISNLLHPIALRTQLSGFVCFVDVSKLKSSFTDSSHMRKSFDCCTRSEMSQVFRPVVKSWWHVCLFFFFFFLWESTTNLAKYLRTFESVHVPQMNNLFVLLVWC